MKRKLLTILTLMLVLLGTLGLAAACKKDEQKPAVAGEEKGEYYCDVNGAEYSLTLTEDCHYTLTLGGDPITGTYAPEGEGLMFTEGDDHFLGSYFNDVVTLTYHTTPYTFLRKIEYTVTFDTHGGSSVDSVTVYNGRRVAAPTAPQKSGSVFVGWYTDKDYKNLYSFSEAVTSSFTLHARFVAPLDPEYTVTFNLNGATGTAPSPVHTVGHQAFGLPTPTWEGHTFLGWWVSHSGIASELTYQYDERLLGGDTTFFAVWASETPAVSVGEKQITWSVQGSATNFTLVIKNRTTDTEVLRTPIDGRTTYSFDFTRQDAGEYVVEVTAGNNTGRAYYRNKALDKVTVFRVEGNTLLFNPVSNATRYFLTVACGDPEGTHVDRIVIDPNTRRFDFSDCTPKDGKITFTVTAEADGYLPSTSEPYQVSRVLAVPTGIAVNSEAVLTWTAVPNAASYDIEIKKGTAVAYSGNVADATELSLKFLEAGTYTINITPKARGWVSPTTPGTYSYTKSTLATPTNIHADLANNKIVWNAVSGASSYEVTIGSHAPVTVQVPEIEFKAEYRVSGQDEYAVSVRALSNAGSSLWSEDYTVRYGKLGGELRYSNGVLSWDPVFGVSSYKLSVNGATESTPYTNVSSIKLEFDREGDYQYALTAGGVTIRTSVSIYEVKLSAPDFGEVESLFLANGDTITLPGAEEISRYGYDFAGWYTEPDSGVLYNDSVYIEGRSRMLYAHWDPKQFHITLVVGSYGVETPEIAQGVTILFGQKIELPVPESNDAAVAFAGWYDAAVGGVQYANYAGSSNKRYSQSADTTFYAQWMTVLSFTAQTDSTGATTGYSVSKSPDIIPTAVTSITIPATYRGFPVTEINDFTNLTHLEVVHIPDSIQSIVVGNQQNPFVGCSSLAEIDVYSTNYSGEKHYFSQNGVLFYDNPSPTVGRELLIYPVAKPGDVYDVPDGVKYIPSYALFELNNLRSISFPSSVTYIEAYAVGGELYSRIRTIAFRGSGAATAPLTIKDGAFQNMDYLTTLKLPANMENFNFWKAFYPDSSYTYSGLETIEIVGTGDYYSQDNMILRKTNSGVELVFYPMSATTFTIPANVTEIGPNAVQYNYNLTKITIPSSISKIGERAFYYATHVRYLEFEGQDGNYPLRIEAYAFYALGQYGESYSEDGKNFTELFLPQNCVYVGAHAFGDTKIDTVHIDIGPNMSQTLEIDSSAFVDNYDSSYYSDSTVTTLYIGPGVRDVNFMSAFGYVLEHVELDPKNTYYSMNADKSALFTAGETEIVWVKPDIESFTIPNTVTKLAPDNFRNRKALKSITIPASVTEIGSGAFEGCSDLQQVTFEKPKTSLTIGDGAFADCEHLTSIAFPEGTTKLGVSVLSGCLRLQSVTLPSTIEEIPDYVSSSNHYFGLFEHDDAISEIKMSGSGSKVYAIENNAVYLLNDKGEKHELVYFAPNANMTTLTIPNTVEVIRPYAMSTYRSVSTAPNLTTVNFEGNAMAAGHTLTVGNHAFSSSVSITSITLPTGTVTIGARAFYNTRITSFEVPNTVTSIGIGAFYNCSVLTNLTFASGNETAALRFEDATDSSAGIIQGTNVTNLVLPERTSSIGSYTFANSFLKSVTIPASVTTIGACAFFSDVSWLQTVTFNPNSKLQYIGLCAFRNSLLKEITIPASVTTIIDGAFYHCADLTTVTFEDGSKLNSLGDGSTNKPDSQKAYGVFEGCKLLSSVNFGNNSGLKTIVTDVFTDCPALKEIVFPLSLETLQDGAFKSTSGIQTVTFEQPTGEKKSKLRTLGAAFTNTGLVSFTFPESEQEILLPESLFSGCSKLTTVHLSSTVLNVWDAFSNGCTALETITVADANPHYYTKDHLLLYANSVADRTTQSDIVFVFGALDGPLTIDEGVVRILAYAFAGTGITSVNIPKKVTTIFEGAFKDCKSLTKVEFANDCALQTIGAFAFSGCEALNTIDFTKTPALQTMEKTTITVKEDYYSTRTYIVGNTFEDCALITSFDFSRTKLEEIPAGAFDGCVGVTSVKVPTALTVFGASLVDTKVSTLDLSRTALTTLGDKLFDGGEHFESIQLPDSLTTIGDFAFRDCTKLTTFDFSKYKQLTTVGYGAFNNTSLTKVVIPKSVNDWGGYEPDDETEGVFGRCAELKEVVFPKDLPADHPDFGYYMFAACPKLDTITFEQGTKVNSFGDYMFAGCNALQSVTLPATFTEVSSSTIYHCFQNCMGLKTVDLSAVDVSSASSAYYRKLTSSAFDGSTNIVEFKLPKGCESIDSTTFSGFVNLQTVEIPETITLIDSSAFYGCTSLTELDLSACENLQKIARSAFAGCTSLATVHLPDSLIEIGAECFKNSGIEHLTIPEAVTTIANNAFEGCVGLETVDFNCGAFLAPRDSSWMPIAAPVNLFRNCTGLQKVSFNGDGLAAIGEGWFNGCTSLATVKLSNSITTLDDNAFLNCAKLATINLDRIISIGDNALEGCTILQTEKVGGVLYVKNVAIQADDDEIKALGGEIELKAGTTGIGVGAFKNSKELKKITLPVSLANIDINAFEGCTALTSVDLSQATGLMAISDSAFLGCTSLKTVTLPSGIVTIGAHAFEGTTIEQITLPDTVTTIGDYAFRNSGLTSVKLPEALLDFAKDVDSGDVTGFGVGVFAGCVNLTNVDFSATKYLTILPAETFQACEQLTGITIPDKIAELGISCLEGTAISGAFAIPNSVTAIDSYAFKNCKNLTEIDLQSNYIKTTDATSWVFTSKLGDGVFMGCVKLSKITLPTTGDFQELSDDTFNGCAAITNLDFLTDNITRIGARCFVGTSIAGDITLPDSISYFGEYAFKGTGITSINMPRQLEYFWDGALEGTKVTSLDFSNCINYTSVMANSFAGMTGLVSVTLPDAVKNINDGAFMGCTGLKDFALPIALEEIGCNAFDGCAQLHDLVFPASLADFGRNAFKGCAGLKSVTLSASVVNFDGRLSWAAGLSVGTFENCTGLTEVDLSACAQLTYIAKDTFKGCENLQTITLPSKLTTIGDSAFEGCTKLVLTIPDTVADIGIAAFKDCTSLTAALKLPSALVDYVPDTESYISYGTPYLYPAAGFAPNAFEGCTGITSVDFTGCEVTAIPDDAFLGCTALQTVTLTDAITAIGDRAFQGCDKLTKPDLKSVTSLGADVFTDTHVLDNIESDREGWYGAIYYIGNVAITCDNDKIESNTVTLREGTIGLAGNLFKGCTNLHTIDLSALKITTLPSGLFQGCTNLTTVTLPSTVTGFGAYCFADCTNLTVPELPAEITLLGEAAFRNTKITEIDLSDSTILEIGAEAFKDCTELKTVTFGSTVRAIGDYAFYGCTQFGEDVTLPNDLRTIGAHAFEECTNLKNVEFPYNDYSARESIGDYAFKGCTKLASVEFGGSGWTSFKSLGASAFEGCTSLTEIDLTNLEHANFGAKAFYGCSQLETVILSDYGIYSNKTFGSQCFAYTAIKVFYIPERPYDDYVLTFEDNVFEGLTGLTIQFGDTESTLRDGYVANFDEFLESLPEGTKVEYGVEG